MRRYLADPSLRPPGPWPLAVKLFIGVTRYVHEKLLGEMHTTLFGQPQNIKMVPWGEEDVPKADLATRFLLWSLYGISDNDWAMTSYHSLFDALLDSASVLKVVKWDMPWAPPTKRAMKSIVRIDPVDLGVMLVPPDATGLQYPQARYVGQDHYLSADDLWRMREKGYDAPDPDEVLEGDSQQPTERQRLEAEREGISLYPYRPGTTLYTEMYERFTLDKAKGQEDVIVSYFPDAEAGDGTHEGAGRIAMVRKLIEVYPQDDRPRRPYFETTVWSQPRQWKGMNVPDRLESMQDMINRLHEQTVNYGDISILPHVFANTFLTGELPNLRQVNPGETVAIDDINGVQFAPTRSLNRHFAEQLNMMFANVERDSSVSDFAVGRSSDRPNAPRTASATLALLQEGRKSYGVMARNAAGQYARMLTFYYRAWREILPAKFTAPLQGLRNIQNENTRDAMIRLFGGNAETLALAMEIKREDVDGLFDVHMMVNPEAPYERQMILALAQTFTPIVSNHAMGLRELYKRVWEAFDQKGFDQIYPVEVAALQTNVQMLSQQVTLEELRVKLMQTSLMRMQLEQQMQQAQMMQEIQAFSQQTGIAPELIMQQLGMQAPQQQGATPENAVSGIASALAPALFKMFGGSSQNGQAASMNGMPPI